MLAMVAIFFLVMLVVRLFLTLTSKMEKMQRTIKFGKRCEKHIFRKMMVRFAATLVVERFLKKMQIRSTTQW